MVIYQTATSDNKPARIVLGKRLIIDLPYRPSLGNLLPDGIVWPAPQATVYKLIAYSNNSRDKRVGEVFNCQTENDKT